jgi:hypothetical protein
MRTCLYEAGINLLWVQAWPLDSGNSFPSEPVTWAGVEMLAQQCFSNEACFEVKEGPAKGTKRLIFPFTLEGWSTKGNALWEPDSFDGKIDLIGGHVAVMAWYLACYRAIKSEAGPLLRLLWECALTVTLLVRVCPNTDALIYSLAFSEKLVAFDLASDSLLTFAKKAWSISLAMALEKDQNPKLKSRTIPILMAEKGIRFQGNAYNDNTHRAVTAIHLGVTSSVEVCLRTIEREFGREVITSTYTKLHKTILVTKNFDGISECSPNDALLWVVESLYIGLKAQVISAKLSITDLVGDKAKFKNGLVQTFLLRAQVHSSFTPCSRPRFLTSARLRLWTTFSR